MSLNYDHIEKALNGIGPLREHYDYFADSSLEALVQLEILIIRHRNERRLRKITAQDIKDMYIVRECLNCTETHFI